MLHTISEEGFCAPAGMVMPGAVVPDSRSASDTSRHCQLKFFGTSVNLSHVLKTRWLLSR